MEKIQMRFACCKAMVWKKHYKNKIMNVVSIVCQFDLYNKIIHMYAKS